MQIKICSLRDPETIAQIAALKPDYMGFCFDAMSEHYLGEVDETLLLHIPRQVRKIGLFRDEAPLRIAALAGRFGLNGVQLQGNESPQVCELLSAEGLEIIKNFDDTNIDKAEGYEGVCNKFILNVNPSKYKGRTPFLYSQMVAHKMFCGLDLPFSKTSVEEIKKIIDENR